MRSKYVFPAVCWLLFSCLPTALLAHGDDEPSAVLWWSFNTGGVPEIWLGVHTSDIATAREAAAVTGALAKIFPCSFEEIDPRNEEDPYWLELWTICDAPLLEREGWGVHGKLDVEPLQKPLRELGVDDLTLQVAPPISSYFYARGPNLDAFRLDDGDDQQTWKLPGDAAWPEISIACGTDANWLIAYCVVLLTLILLDLGLSIHLRNAALRNARQDRAAAWFRYSTTATGMRIVFLFLWIAFPAMLRADAWMRFLLPISGWPFDALFIFSHGLLFTAITLTMVRFMHPVLEEVRGLDQETARDTVRRTALALFAFLLPVLLFYVGIKAYGDGFTRVAAGFGIAAVLVFFGGLLSLMQKIGWTPHDLAPGELLDAVEELAADAGVEVKKVQLISGMRPRMANAGAILGGGIFLTEYLVRNLSRREVRAVIAHELIHLREGDNRRRMLRVFKAATASALATVAGFVALSFFGVIDHHAWLAAPRITTTFFVMLCLACLFAVPGFLHFHRRDELRSDLEAVRLTEDPEALITALTRLNALNLLPMHWSKSQNWLMTHPSTRRRAEAIAEEADLSEERLEELIGEVGLDPERFSLPLEETAPTNSSMEDAALGTIDESTNFAFSARFRQSAASKISLIQTIWALIGPLLLWLAVLAAVPSGVGRWLGVAAASLVHRMILSGMLDRLALLGYRDLREKLTERLAPPPDALFVGFGPDPEPMIYETHFDWDVGFLTVSTERLQFDGERVSFAVPRDEVDVRIARLPGWLPAGRVSVAWNDSEGVVAGCNLSVIGPTLRTTHQATLRLGEEIRGRASRKPADPPSFPEAAKQSLESIWNPKNFFFANLFLFLMPFLAGRMFLGDAAGALPVGLVGLFSSFLSQAPWLRRLPTNP